ncbi:hypothetical protein [Pseudomonas sp. NPDC087614]|uniref:hypothetical protein n=1 Tax=Pseudomonas sp. NPDC087614 TaxID=3364442 RepID=UPI0028EAC2CB|nr:hypothetical protein [uncultured Pseudomonas sp.]
MSGLKWRWLVFTVLFGMIPIFIRLLVGGFDLEGRVSLVSSSDFIALGLVLQVSLFNEIKYNNPEDADWRQVIIGVSALYMLVYAVLYVLLLISEYDKGIDTKMLLYVSMILAGVSFLLCLAVYDRLTVAAQSRG